MPVSALRVLMTADAVGGVWQYSLDLAGGLSRRGLSVTLAVLGPAPSEAQSAQASASGCRVLATGLPLDWTARNPDEVTQAAAALARLSRDMSADIVHLHSPAFAAAAFPVPVVAVCHSCVATWWGAVGDGPLPDDLAWRRDLVGRGCRAADTLLAPTHAFARATQAAYGLPAAPIVVQNGRRLPFAESAPPMPAPFAFTAGRLWDRAKNAAALDQMAGRLTCPVLAAGPAVGPNGERFAASHLRLLGPLDDADIAARLASRPVFVSLARYEPFGLAVLEAAAAGCALVLSDIPSFRELWDGAASFVDAGDDAAAAEAVTASMEDEAARGARGEAAQVRAARYGVEPMADGVLGVFRGLLAAPSRAGAAA